MAKQNIKHLVLLLIINLGYLSCTKPVDFDQLNDLELSPVMETSLVFLDEPVSSFLNNENEVVTTQDFILIDFLNNQFVEENLIKADFVFETSNSINREFEVQIDFIDALDETRHTFTFSVTPSTNNANNTSSYTEVFEDDSLAALKTTRKMVFTMRLLPGDALTQNTPGSISIKSKAVFYLNFDI